MPGRVDLVTQWVYCRYMETTQPTSARRPSAGTVIRAGSSIQRHMYPEHYILQQEAMGLAKHLLAIVSGCTCRENDAVTLLVEHGLVVCTETHDSSPFLGYYAATSKGVALLGTP